MDKRKKNYSLGKWVSTSPHYINESYQIVSNALTIQINKDNDNPLKK